MKEYPRQDERIRKIIIAQSLTAKRFLCYHCNEPLELNSVSRNGVTNITCARCGKRL